MQPNASLETSVTMPMTPHRDGDIRTWMFTQSPTARLQQCDSPRSNAGPPAQSPHPRRRRIVESDSSDVPNGGGAAAVEINDVVHLTSDSDDGVAAAAQQIRPAPMQSPRATPNRRSPPAGNIPRSSSRRQPLSAARAPRRRRLEAEAEETDDVDDDSSECVESDTRARDLYRSAILGVRNARNARAHMRTATSVCPACALFAAFLEHFVA
jgi:hypothetical protein